MVMFDGYLRTMSGVGLAVGRQPSKLIYTGSIPVPRSKPHCNQHDTLTITTGADVITDPSGRTAVGAGL